MCTIHLFLVNLYSALTHHDQTRTLKYFQTFLQAHYHQSCSHRQYQDPTELCLWISLSRVFRVNETCNIYYIEFGLLQLLKSFWSLSCGSISHYFIPFLEVNITQFIIDTHFCFSIEHSTESWILSLFYYYLNAAMNIDVNVLVCSISLLYASRSRRAIPFPLAWCEPSHFSTSSSLVIARLWL